MGWRELLAGALVVSAAWGFVVLCAWLRREVRHHRVRAERDGADLQRAPSPRTSAPGRTGLDRDPLRLVRLDEPRDRGAARRAAFTARLAQDGRYVHELDIERRLN